MNTNEPEEISDERAYLQMYQDGKLDQLPREFVERNIEKSRRIIAAYEQGRYTPVRRIACRANAEDLILSEQENSGMYD